MDVSMRPPFKLGEGSSPPSQVQDGVLLQTAEGKNTCRRADGWREERDHSGTEELGRLNR